MFEKPGLMLVMPLFKDSLLAKYYLIYSFSLIGSKNSLIDLASAVFTSTSPMFPLHLSLKSSLALGLY